MGPAVALCPPQRCPALPRRGEHVPWQRYSSSGTAGGWEERQSPRKKYRMGSRQWPPLSYHKLHGGHKRGDGDAGAPNAPRSQSPRARWAPWGGRWRRDAAAPMGAVFGEKAPAPSPPAARMLRPAAAPLPAPKISLSARCPGSRLAHSTRTSSCCRRLSPFGKKAFFFPPISSLQLKGQSILHLLPMARCLCTASPTRFCLVRAGGGRTQLPMGHGVLPKPPKLPAASGRRRRGSGCSHQHQRAPCLAPFLPKRAKEPQILCSRALSDPL